ncbi:MAG: hypothetical protein J0H10_15850 [Alphaproteobacteria bacterium]|nr:hypothetical protein [Alphaproteobacteria bacterium]
MFLPQGAAAVTASDTAFVDYVGFYVGGTGDVAVQTAKGDTVTFKAMPVGAVIHLHIVKVLSTGTTATNIVGLKA